MISEQTRKLKAIKCAWTTPVLGVDGNLLYFAPLLKHLSDEFREFTVITSEFKGNSESAGFDILVCGNYKRLYKNERFETTDKTAYISGISIASPGIIKKLIAKRYELIIINEFSVFSLYASLAKYFTRSKVLCIVEAKPRASGKRPIRIARHLFRKIICMNVNAFLTNNSDGKKYLMDELGINSSKIVARPYLISDLSTTSNTTNAITDSHIEQKSSKVKLLYVGQLIPRKGVHLAIESLSLLNSETKKMIEFNIIGNGAQRDYLKKLVEEIGLESVVKFHGRVDYEMLGHYYSASDAFIFPTLSDYRALTPFEALSYGLPIFASIHDGGIAETVINGKNGYSFDPVDVTQLKNVLEPFIHNKKMRLQYSQVSKTISEKYTIKSATQTLVDACNLALGFSESSSAIDS